MGLLLPRPKGLRILAIIVSGQPSLLYWNQLNMIADITLPHGDVFNLSAIIIGKIVAVVKVCR